MPIHIVWTNYITNYFILASDNSIIILTWHNKTKNEYLVINPAKTLSILHIHIKTKIYRKLDLVT